MVHCGLDKDFASEFHLYKVVVLVYFLIRYKSIIFLLDLAERLPLRIGRVESFTLIPLAAIAVVVTFIAQEVKQVFFYCSLSKNIIIHSVLLRGTAHFCQYVADLDPVLNG